MDEKEPPAPAEKSRSDDFKPRPPELVTHRTVAKAWLPEIASCTIGLLIFTSMAITLSVFDGKEQPQLPLGLTINSALQYLTTFTKLAFVVPIIEGLGQLKWLWFASGPPRPLLDFELYEEATRGGLIAIFKLFFRLRGVFRWPLPWLASALLVSALFTSAVTQQVVSFESQLVPSDSLIAKVERASAFSRWNGNEFQLHQGDQLEMEHAIISAAYLDPSSKTVPPLQPSCLTSNCKWPAYGTIGICADVANVTDSANNGDLQRLYFAMANESIANLNSNLRRQEFALPLSYTVGGLWMAEPSYVFDMDVTSAALSNILLLYSNGPVNITTLQPQDLHYAEIILYACVRGLKSDVTAGVSTTEQTGSRAKIALGNVTSLNTRWNLDKFDFVPQLTCKPGVAGQTIRLALPPVQSREEEVSFEMDLCTTLMASSVINGYLPGFIALRATDRGVLGSVGQISTALSVALFGGFMGDTPSREEQGRNLRGIVRNIGDGLTNMIRSNGASYTNSSGLVAGTTLDARTIVRVRWAWFALLAAQLVLTGVFIIGTIIATSGVGLQSVKGSSLATLCVLEDRVRSDLGPAGDLVGQSRLAAGIVVNLQRGESLRLVRPDLKVDSS